MKKALRRWFHQGYILIRGSSIFSRLLISFLLVILIPAFVIINFLYKNAEKEFYRTGINYIDQNLDSTVQKTYDAYRIYELEMEGMLTDGQIGKLLKKESNVDKSEMSQLLYHKKESISCENLFVITQDHVYMMKEQETGKDGITLVDEQKFRKSKAYQKGTVSSLNTNWFNTIKENNMYYSNANKNSYMGNYLTLTSKIMDGDQVLGLLVANIDIARMSAIADIDKMYNQDLFLVDKEGIITYLNIDYVYRNYPDHIWSKALKNPNKIVSCEVQGKETLFVVEKMSKSDWYVISVIIKDNLLQASYKLRKQMVIVVCISILISLLICTIVTLSISYPLKKIKIAMSSYAEKDLKLEFEDVGKDQITEVSHRFKEMSHRIGDLVEKEIQAENQIIEEKLKEKEMLFSALQMQINPHFLYNTLDLIRWNVINLEKGNDRISKMIAGYSNMLRYNIRLGEGFATIQEEIDYTGKYIRLLDMLYDIDICLEVESNGINLEHIQIGKLFFQPVIENAMIHGKLNLVEKPLIRIEIKQQEKLLISIMNNGRKMSEVKIYELNQELSCVNNESTRVGLANINQRIRLLFGVDYGLSVAERNEMVCFTIRLPING